MQPPSWRWAFPPGWLPAVANEIGQVKVLVDYGYSTAPGESRGPIYVRDDVVAESLLETVRDGRVDIEFDDKTKLIVGPNSTVKLDRFVYDPNKSSGEVAVNMSRGVLRFVTGRLSSQSYKIKTPTATMGVRGTDFVVLVDEAGATQFRFLMVKSQCRLTVATMRLLAPGIRALLQARRFRLLL